MQKKNIAIYVVVRYLEATDHCRHIAAKWYSY